MPGLETKNEWSEWRYRLHSPDLFDKCRRVDLGTGVDGVYCHKKGGDEGDWQMQALRFDKGEFPNEADVRAWLKEHEDEAKASVKLDAAGEDCAPLSGEAEPMELAVMIEAASQTPKGNVWRVRLFAFGPIDRPPGYVLTPSTMANSRKVLERVDVYAHSQADDFGHKDSSQVVPRDKVGVIANISVELDGVYGDLHVLPSAEWLKNDLMYATQNDLPVPYELSIRAIGTYYRGTWEGKEAMIAEAFTFLAVDVVDRGAAGGQFLRLVASKTLSRGGTQMDREKLLAELRASFKGYLESRKLDDVALGKLTDEQLLDEIKAAAKWVADDARASKEAEMKAASEAAAKKAAEKITLDDETAKRIASLEASQRQAALEAKLVASQLPGEFQALVREQFVGKEFKAEDVDTAITRIRKAHADFVAAAPGQWPSANIGLEGIDKVRLGIEGLFMLDPNRPRPEMDKPEEIKASLKGVPAYRSIKAAYVDATGDVMVTGRRDTARISASLATTDWTSIITTAMNKRLVRDYGVLNLDTWRVFTDVVPITNLMQQERVRYGGYSDLPTVAQRAPYLPLTSPTDEKAYYTPAKRGGTEDLSREMIINDQVGSVTKIPQRMATAAGRTLHGFVYTFISPGDAALTTIYDGAALYSHTNAGTAALDANALAAARLRMLKQVEKDNSKRLGIEARYLIVPPDLQQAAYGLVTPAFDMANAVPTFLQQLGITPIVAPFWTDANDWVLVADRASVVGIEVGFLNGQEQPEMFVSQAPDVGSWFTNDVLTYKIRHEYGGAITDYRAFDGSVVS